MSLPTPAVLPFSALEALEWTDMPMWVLDLGGKCMRWANAAGLSFWHASSLEEFLARDFSDLSPSTVIRNQMQMEDADWIGFRLGEQLDLGQHLVGEAIGHHETGVPGRAT